MPDDGVPRKEMDLPQRPTKCTLEESTTPDRYRASTTRSSAGTFSDLFVWPSSGHAAPLHPENTVEAGCSPAQKLSGISSDGCTITAAKALFDQKNSYGRDEDRDELACSDGDHLDGDHLISLGSNDMKQLGRGLFEGCQVELRTSSPDVRGVTGGCYVSGHEDSNTCQGGLGGLEIDQTSLDTAKTESKITLMSAAVERDSSSDGVWLKNQPLSERCGPWSCSGLVAEEGVPNMLEEPTALRAKSYWEVAEASGISERNAATSVERLDAVRMRNPVSKDMLEKSTKSITAPVDWWSYRENGDSEVSMLPDTNEHFTYSYNLTASMQPYLPISPKPLGHQQDTSSNRATELEASRGRLPRPLSTKVYSGTSDASRMPPPPPPALSAGPTKSLEAYTLYRTQVSNFAGQWQLHPNHDLCSAASAKAPNTRNTPTPSITGRSQPQEISPKAPFPTTSDSGSSAIASFPRSFTRLPPPAPASIKAGTSFAKSTLFLLFCNLVPYLLILFLTPFIPLPAFKGLLYSIKHAVALSKIPFELPSGSITVILRRFTKFKAFIVHTHPPAIT